MRRTQLATTQDYLGSIDYILNHLIDSGLVDASNYAQALTDTDSMLLHWELQLLDMKEGN